MSDPTTTRAPRRTLPWNQSTGAWRWPRRSLLAWRAAAAAIHFVGHPGGGAMAELLEREELPEVLTAPEEEWVAPQEESIRVPPAPPDGLDTVLYEYDDRLARRDL